MTEQARKYIDNYNYRDVRRLDRIEQPKGPYQMRNFHMAKGIKMGEEFPNPIIRANMVKKLFEDCLKYIPEGELIAGSLAGQTGTITKEEAEEAEVLMAKYPLRNFRTKADHYAANYVHFLADGIPGTFARLEESAKAHAGDSEKETFIEAMKISLNALVSFIEGYEAEAKKLGRDDIAEVCRAIIERKPESFREALQLVMFIHITFCYEGRYAQALGRLDQYLYPYYRRDIDSGEITNEDAVRMLMSAFGKLENNVVNIAVAGVKRDGSDATNDLTYAVLEAVGRCNVPGPNLSARLHNNISDRFLDEALKVIGSGLGYPALMNDEVNIPALHRHGYSLEDARDYCMVGCIENFIQGKQPPWSDSGIDTPKMFEYVMNNGVDILTGQKTGIDTGDIETLDTMDKFVKAFEDQLRHAAKLHVESVVASHNAPDKKLMTQPYLSLFCDDCIGRGMDINDGGAIYPSAHGIGAHGIGTVSDSMAAIEKFVYNEKKITLTELRDAIRANFEGYEELRQLLLSAPKYGNNDDFVDKYAVWFVRIHDEIITPYKGYDGGPFYTAIASNIHNVLMKDRIAATPNGRFHGEAISDAASPSQGCDTSGPTAVVLSLTKPDYKTVSCGTVVNQKYSPEMFRDPEKRAKLAAMIRTYFKLGGQEMQINSVSREVLRDAMDNPDNYRSLVVRVSGFSAYYTGQRRGVQEDILRRTEHE